MLDFTIRNAIIIIALIIRNLRMQRDCDSRSRRTVLSGNREHIGRFHGALIRSEQQMKDMRENVSKLA